MLRLNRNRLSESREKEMRDYLKEAVRAFNAGAVRAATVTQYRAVA
jgi:hypothetical protein